MNKQKTFMWYKLYADRIYYSKTAHMGNVLIRRLIGNLIDKINSKGKLPRLKWKVASYLDTVYSNFAFVAEEYRTLNRFFYCYMLHINSIVSYEGDNHSHNHFLVYMDPTNPKVYLSTHSSFLQKITYIFI